MAKSKPNNSDTKGSQKKKTKKNSKPSSGKDKNVKPGRTELMEFQ